jgi:hypothetical protein
MKISQLIAFDNILVDRTADITPIMTGKKFRPPFELKDKDTFIGIEMEVERVFREKGVLSINDNFYLWDNIADGSLRNNGREFVSIPLKGDNVSFALKELNTILTTDKQCIGHEYTDRTSVHVHVNVRDIDVNHFKNLLLTYLVVEPLLYAFVGGDRAKNIFCVPITESHLTDRLSYIMSEENPKSVLDHTRHWYKYTGLNLLPVRKYGTVEFRHMVGTNSEEFLHKWLNLILSIKSYSGLVPFEKNKERILSLNTNSEYFNYLRDVFGYDVDLGEFQNIENTLEKTSIFIKDVFAYNENVFKKLLKTAELKEAEKNAPNLPFFKNSVTRKLVKMYSVQDEIDRINKEIEKLRSHVDSVNKKIAVYERDMKKPENKGMVDAYKAAIQERTENRDYNIERIKEYEKQIAALKTPVVEEEKPVDMELEFLLQRAREMGIGREVPQFFGGGIVEGAQVVRAVQWHNPFAEQAEDEEDF